MPLPLTIRGIGLEIGDHPNLGITVEAVAFTQSRNEGLNLRSGFLGLDEFCRKDLAKSVWDWCACFFHPRTPLSNPTALSMKGRGIAIRVSFY